MGLLKELYAIILNRKSNRDAFCPSVDKERKTRPLERAAARKALSDDIESIGRMLLINADQRNPQILRYNFGKIFQGRDPDELNELVQSDVELKKYMDLLKQCILDLEDINGQGKGDEFKDELAKKTLNALHKQAACVYALKGAKKESAIYLFVSEPEKYVEWVLETDDRKNPFSGVKYEDDLSDFDEQLRFFIEETLKTNKETCDQATITQPSAGKLSAHTLITLFFLQKKKLLPFKYSILTEMDDIFGVTYGRLAERFTAGAVEMTKDEINNSFIQMTVDLDEEEEIYATYDISTEQRVSKLIPRSK